MSEPYRGVLLYRFSSTRDRRIKTRLGIDVGDLESLRASRIHRALEDKLPKLEAAREHEGADATMLLLETADDAQLADAFDIAETVQTLLTHADRAMPDHVLLVSPEATWVIVSAGRPVPFIRS